jgi:hypothetical protein
MVRSTCGARGASQRRQQAAGAAASAGLACASYISEGKHGGDDHLPGGPWRDEMNDAAQKKLLKEVHGIPVGMCRIGGRNE